MIHVFKKNKRGCIINMKNIVSVLVVGLFIFTSLGATAFSRDVSEQIITIDTISFSPPLLSNKTTIQSLHYLKLQQI